MEAANQGGGNPGKRKATAPPDPPEPPSRSASNDSNVSGESEPDEDITLLVINFDGTLTTAKPFMRDPSLFEASKGFITTESLRGIASMTDPEHLANFGGQESVDALRELLTDCRENGIQVYLICDGKSKAANRALESVGLHSFVTGVIGSNDEPFATDPEIGKYAAIEYLQKLLKLRRTQIFWVASKAPDVESVADLGVASLQIDFDLGFVASALDQVREVLGLLTAEQEDRALQEAGASEIPGMDEFLS